MNWTLEVVVVPVADVDRAKAFYADQLRFHVDHDVPIADGARLVQLTPPGSGCSIVIGHGVVPHMEPGSLRGLQLVVNDLAAAREQMLAAGIDASPIEVLAPDGPRSAQEGDDLDNVAFVRFADPDGNQWAVQQISSRP